MGGKARAEKMSSEKTESLGRKSGQGQVGQEKPMNWRGTKMNGVGDLVLKVLGGLAALVGILWAIYQFATRNRPKAVIPIPPQAPPPEPVPQTTVKTTIEPTIPGEETQGAELQRELGELVVGSTVEAFFGHAPDDMKARMKSEFYENLNRSEQEYSHCVELLSGSNEKTIARLIAEGGTRRGLVNQLSDNIARAIGRELDVVVIGRVKDVAFAASQSMNLVELVQAAGKEL